MKGRFIDPSEVARAYRDPLSWASLAVDLLPILAVIAFSWGPTPLVALYWLENLVIGHHDSLVVGIPGVAAHITKCHLVLASL